MALGTIRDNLLLNALFMTLSIQEIPNGKRLKFDMRRPGMYLDHCALRTIASSPEYVKRLKAIFKGKGTLFFSWMNFSDIRGHRPGASIENLKVLFEGIGNHWIPIDFNPLRVISKEKENNPKQKPAFDEIFASEYYPHIHDGPLSLCKAVELAQSDETKAGAMKVKENLRILVEEMERRRKQWASDSRARKLISLRIKSLNRAQGIEFVYRSLQKNILKNKFKISINDVIDWWHTAVPLATADIIVLDKRWAELARQVRLSPARVRVFSVKEIEVFLRDLECR